MAGGTRGGHGDTPLAPQALVTPAPDTSPPHSPASPTVLRATRSRGKDCAAPPGVPRDDEEEDKGQQYPRHRRGCPEGTRG